LQDVRQPSVCEPIPLDAGPARAAQDAPPAARQCQAQRAGSTGDTVPLGSPGQAAAAGAGGPLRREPGDDLAHRPAEDLEVGLKTTPLTVAAKDGRRTVRAGTVTLLIDLGLCGMEEPLHAVVPAFERLLGYPPAGGDSG